MDPSPLEPVNDVHSALNPAAMRIHRPRRVEEVTALVNEATASGAHIAVCGGRHAMGGQQFANGNWLLDLTRLSSILHFDMQRGTVRAEGGIQWPGLIRGIREAQRSIEPDRQPRWGIAQKQTGADTLSLGGSVSANIHGRGLLMGPLVSDIEAFTLIGPDGVATTCSRTENPRLFSLAAGGYGLFGVIADVTLRLSPLRTVRRVVRVIDIEDAVNAAERRIEAGFLYGDFQFDVDAESPGFLTKGVFSAYEPVAGDPEPPQDQRSLSRDDWLELLTLAHTDKSRAFSLYARHYLSTDGQLYKSDTHQLSEYIHGYHKEVDRQTHAECPGSEMITELYVPPERLVDFLRAAAKLLIEHEAQVIYGTVRLIQPEEDTVMAWASRRFACTVLNLHIDHSGPAIDRAAGTFRALIDLAADMGGSYYLTYHRFATAQQLERCYPRTRAFFAAKRQHDPSGVFQSDWYRHYAPHFSGGEP